MSPKEIEKYRKKMGWRDSYTSLCDGPGFLERDREKNAEWWENYESSPARKYEHLSGYRWARYRPHTTVNPFKQAA